MGMLKIGDLAKRTQINNETIRFYETKGLLEAPMRSDAGYRLYTQNDVARLNFIVRAKGLGFSLKEIMELLSLKVEKEDSTCGEVKALAEKKLDDIAEKLIELNRMKLALEKITLACCGGEESAVHCTILNALED